MTHDPRLGERLDVLAVEIAKAADKWDTATDFGPLHYLRGLCDSYVIMQSGYPHDYELDEIITECRGIAAIIGGGGVK